MPFVKPGISMETTVQLQLLSGHPAIPVAGFLVSVQGPKV